MNRPSGRGDSPAHTSQRPPTRHDGPAVASSAHRQPRHVAWRWSPWAIRVAMAAGLAIDAYVHLDVASLYAETGGTINEGALFRAEAVAALLAAIAVIAIGRRACYLAALAVAATGLAAAIIAGRAGGNAAGHDPPQP